jgi:hypothetical protein
VFRLAGDKWLEAMIADEAAAAEAEFNPTGRAAGPLRRQLVAAAPVVAKGSDRALL